MNGEREARTELGLGMSLCRGNADLPGVQESPATTLGRTADLDLLRLSYVCRMDALFLGMPERSVALARIHRFFDRAPRGAALDDLLLSALIAPACGNGEDRS